MTEAASTKDNHLMDLVRVLVSLIEEKDIFLKGHSERVASTCASFSRKLGLSEEEIEKHYLAGLLHDLGMIHMPLEIIHKEGELAREERRLIKQHPLIAEKILGKNKMLMSILPIVRHHHEAFDGTGYPDGLKGEDIPLGSRILRLADSYDALISTRPHRPGMNSKKAMAHIEKKKGKEFDEILAGEFLAFLRSLSGLTETGRKKQERERLRKTVLDIVQEFKEGKIQLPHLPRIVHEIQKVAYNPASTVEDLARVIERDAVISLKLISLANSSWYRRLERIYSVQRAIPLLGFRETQGIIIAIAYRDLYEAESVEYRVLMENLWMHCLASAFAAKAIGQKIEFEDVDKLFLMGLVHDIGKVPLLKVLSERGQEGKAFNVADVLLVIKKVYPVVSDETLKRWKFGEEFIRVARLQGLTTFNESTEPSVLAVNLASNLACHIGYGDGIDNEEMHLQDLESVKWLGFDSDTLEAMEKEVGEIVRQSAHYF